MPILERNNGPVFSPDTPRGAPGEIPLGDDPELSIAEQTLALADESLHTTPGSPKEEQLVKRVEKLTTKAEQAGSLPPGKKYTVDERGMVWDKSGGEFGTRNEAEYLKKHTEKNESDLPPTAAGGQGVSGEGGGRKPPINTTAEADQENTGLDPRFTTPEKAKQILVAMEYFPEKWNDIMEHGPGGQLLVSHEVIALITIARGSEPRMVGEVSEEIRRMDDPSPSPDPKGQKPRSLEAQTSPSDEYYEDKRTKITLSPILNMVLQGHLQGLSEDEIFQLVNEKYPRVEKAQIPPAIKFLYERFGISFNLPEEGKKQALNDAVRNTEYKISDPRGGSRTIRILGPREKEILGLVADGLTNKQIASQLGISEDTVRNIIDIIFNKTGVSNRTEAVLMAMRVGLLEPTEQQGHSPRFSLVRDEIENLVEPYSDDPNNLPLAALSNLLVNLTDGSHTIDEVIALAHRYINSSNISGPAKHELKVQISNILGSLKESTSLTPRQTQVLELLVQELSFKEIVEKTGMSSLGAVYDAAVQMYATLGVHSKKEAIIVAKELGILPAEKPPDPDLSAEVPPSGTKEDPQHPKPVEGASGADDYEPEKEDKPSARPPEPGNISTAIRGASSIGEALEIVNISLQTLYEQARKDLISTDKLAESVQAVYDEVIAGFSGDIRYGDEELQSIIEAIDRFCEYHSEQLYGKVHTKKEADDNPGEEKKTPHMTRQQAAMFKLLMKYKGRTVDDGRLIAWIWGFNVGPERARKPLQRMISRLRKVLPPGYKLKRVSGPVSGYRLIQEERPAGSGENLEDPNNPQDSISPVEGASGADDEPITQPSSPLFQAVRQTVPPTQPSSTLKETISRIRNNLFGSSEDQYVREANNRFTVTRVPQNHTEAREFLKLVYDLSDSQLDNAPPDRLRVAYTRVMNSAIFIKPEEIMRDLGYLGTPFTQEQVVDIREATINDAVALLNLVPEIDTLFIFGSTVSGRAPIPESDVDLLIVPTDDSPDTERKIKDLITQWTTDPKNPEAGPSVVPQFWHTRQQFAQLDHDYLMQRIKTMSPNSVAIFPDEETAQSMDHLFGLTERGISRIISPQLATSQPAEGEELKSKGDEDESDGSNNKPDDQDDPDGDDEPKPPKPGGPQTPPRPPPTRGGGGPHSPAPEPLPRREKDTTATLERPALPPVTSPSDDQSPQGHNGRGFQETVFTYPPSTGTNGTGPNGKGPTPAPPVIETRQKTPEQIFEEAVKRMFHRGAISGFENISTTKLFYQDLAWLVGGDSELAKELMEIALTPRGRVILERWGFGDRIGAAWQGLEEIKRLTDSRGPLTPKKVAKVVGKELLNGSKKVGKAAAIGIIIGVKGAASVIAEGGNGVGAIFDFLAESGQGLTTRANGNGHANGQVGKETRQAIEAAARKVGKENRNQWQITDDKHGPGRKVYDEAIKRIGGIANTPEEAARMAQEYTDAVSNRTQAARNQASVAQNLANAQHDAQSRITTSTNYAKATEGGLNVAARLEQIASATTPKDVQRLTTGLADDMKAAAEQVRSQRQATRRLSNAQHDAQSRITTSTNYAKATEGGLNVAARLEQIASATTPKDVEKLESDLKDRMRKAATKQKEAEVKVKEAESRRTQEAKSTKERERADEQAEKTGKEAKQPPTERVQTPRVHKKIEETGSKAGEGGSLGAGEAAGGLVAGLVGAFAKAVTAGSSGRKVTSSRPKDTGRSKSRTRGHAGDGSSKDEINQYKDGWTWYDDPPKNDRGSRGNSSSKANKVPPARPPENVNDVLDDFTARFGGQENKTPNYSDSGHQQWDDNGRSSWATPFDDLTGPQAGRLADIFKARIKSGKDATGVKILYEQASTVAREKSE